MNERLSTSASPYLRAHAGNPVAWYPWGEAAFAEARRRDVPVFVSIGYSTCHWCHVMARESFADAATAADLDDGFVAVKVDREEHPEVDAAYMAAASAFTPSLGWPLSVFTTPEGRPFFAGTYYPPTPRSGMPSFRQVLAAVREAWTERRTHVTETADAIVSALADVRSGALGQDGIPPGLEQVHAAARDLAAREDPEHGGFWGGDPAAPKFPVATALGFLLCRAVRTGAPDASAVATRALRAMVASPLRDAVEGGFFRYATRRDWTVPHYERMLTDNALLLDAALAAGDDETVRGVADFLLSVLQQPSGGIGAAQDSESWIDGARSEGGYYLRADRAGLEPPAVDGKIVTGWNGLAIGALARAGAHLGEQTWIDAASWAADAVLGANVRHDGLLVRSSLDEIPSRAAATLADYGQLATGLVALAVATGQPALAVRARELVLACVDEDPPSVPGGGDPVLGAQGIGGPDAASDGDEPSGIAALADAAAQLWLLGGGDALRDAAEGLVARHAAAALDQPLAYGALLRVAALLAAPPRQIVVVGQRGDPLARVAHGLDADIIAVVSADEARAWIDAGFELFDGKAQIYGRATVYDCHDFTCRLPVTAPEELDAAR